MTAQMCISCQCGAHYEREEVRLPIKDIGVYECRQCGEILERWGGRVVPKFTPLPATPTKRSSVA